MAPKQCVARGVRECVGQDRKHECLAVPEGVPVVTWPGQTLRCDRASLAPSAGLQDMEEREAHTMLQLGITVQLNVGALPEVVEIRSLAGDKPVQPV